MFLKEDLMFLNNFCFNEGEVNVQCEFLSVKFLEVILININYRLIIWSSLVWIQFFLLIM